MKDELSIQKFMKYIIGILYSRGTVAWMPNCSPLWFLTTLFIARVLYYWINKLNTKNQIFDLVLVILAGLVSWILDIKDIPKLLWNIDTAMMALGFLYVGRLLSKERCFEQEKYRRWHFILIYILLIVGCIGIIANPIDSVNFDNNQYGNLVLMLLGAFGVGLFMIILCYTYKRLWTSSAGRFLEFLGKHTIFIMGFDYFSSSIGRFILGRLSLYHWTTLFSLKIILLIVGLFLWNFIINKLPVNIACRLDY